MFRQRFMMRFKKASWYILAMVGVGGFQVVQQAYFRQRALSGMDIVMYALWLVPAAVVYALAYAVYEWWPPFWRRGFASVLSTTYRNYWGVGPGIKGQQVAAEIQTATARRT
jgi:hypothetical protein